MKCRTARQLISSFVDATLDEGREQAFVSHVQRCDGCRQLLDEARLAREALHGFIAEDMAVPEDLSARIKGAIRQAEEDTTIIETSSTPAIGSPAFIATCASLFIGAVMFYVVTTEVYMERLDAQERTTSIAADMTRLRSGTQSRLAHAAASPTANDPGLALLAAPVGTDKDGSAPEVETDPAAAPDMFQSLTVRTPTTGLSTLGKTATSPTVRHKRARTEAPADAARPAASAASAEKKSPVRIAGGTGAAASTGGAETEVRGASIVDAKVSTTPRDEPQDAFLSFYKELSETQAGSPLRVGAVGYFVCRPGWEADAESYVPEHTAPPGEQPSRCGAAPD